MVIALKQFNEMLFHSFPFLARNWSQVLLSEWA